MKIKLVECIGNTWQGEGPDSGKKMTLVRFQKCDRVVFKRACKWCDTLVKMRVSCEAEYDINDIQSFVKLSGGLMITGGEPTFQDNLEDTKLLLKEIDYDVCNIETNGYALDKIIDYIPFLEKEKQLKTKIIYSPKIFDECDYEDTKALIRRFHRIPQLYIKFVNDDRSFLKNILYYITTLNMRSDQVWLMPLGATKEDILQNSKNVIDKLEEYNINFSSRNHIIYDFI